MLAGFTFASLLATAAIAAEKAPAEVAGGADHPLIKRFAGSTLIGYKAADWDQAVMPMSLPQEADKDLLRDKQVVEGRITRLVYLAPVGKTSLEVFRNHEQALNAAGFKKQYACEQDCAYLFFAWSKADQPEKGLTWSKGAIRQAAGDGSYNVSDALSHDDSHLWVGKRATADQDLTVLLYTSDAVNKNTNMAATYLTIAEAKGMPTGQVTVDASAMKNNLQTDGKVALYGLFFDTGTADVKPESKAQLEEMASC